MSTNWRSAFGRAVSALLVFGASLLACAGATEVRRTCPAGENCVIAEFPIRIEIPAAAIPAGGLDLTMTQVNNPPDSTTIVPGATWTVGPAGTQFSPPATLMGLVAAADLSGLDGVHSSELRLYSRQGDAWVAVPGQTYDAGAGTLTASIEAVGTYTVMGMPVESVAIAPAGAVSVQVGASTALTATPQGAGAEPLPQRPVSWSTSNGGIATVSASGNVSGVVAGSATITAESEGVSATKVVTVTAGSPPPPGPSTEPVPSEGDVILYDDNFSGFATLAARRTHRNALVAGSDPFYFFDGPNPGSDREALDSIVSPGYDGSPYAYRLRMPAEMTNFHQATMNAEVFHRSSLPGGARFHPPGATLIVDLWLRIDYPAQNLLWIKGLELFHSFDRSQYGVYLSSATLGWANIHPQSNNREIYMHLENGAPDAPQLFRRWTNISTGQWLKHTFVYKASSGTGTQRDGINRWYVNGEKIIDASLEGLNNGWMVDRVNGVSASSTSPYPGNVGDKYTNVTGDQALLGLSDDPVIRVIFPGIFSTSASGGGGTVDVGRIRVWYRP